jgi:hypothetical protein
LRASEVVPGDSHTPQSVDVPLAVNSWMTGYPDTIFTRVPCDASDNDAMKALQRGLK